MKDDSQISGRRRYSAGCRVNPDEDYTSSAGLKGKMEMFLTVRSCNKHGVFALKHAVATSVD